MKRKSEILSVPIVNSLFFFQTFTKKYNRIQSIYLLGMRFTPLPTQVTNFNEMYVMIINPTHFFIVWYYDCMAFLSSH